MKFLMKIVWNFLVLHVLIVESFSNFELIFSLREHFSSDVVLLAINGSNVELGKKLFKFKRNSPSEFLGIINLDKNADEFLPVSQISKFQNIMIASDGGEYFIKKMIELEGVLAHLMSSLVFVLFEQNDVSARLEKFYIPFNYKFLLIKKNYEILDVYQIGVNGSKIYSHFSNWGNSKKFETFAENFYQRRMDLKGHALNAMYAPGHGSTEYWESFSEIMNFTVNHVPTTYGRIFPNGTKTGFFQMIDDHIIDATYHNFKFSHERAEYFDYVFPAHIAGTKMYVALNQEINWATFISPFSIAIWISIFAWIIVASTILFIINKYSMRNKPGNSFFNIIKAFFSQGGIINNSNISFYIAYFTTYIVGLIMVQAYSGVFLSYLTVKNTPPPFKNLKEIIQVGTHKILVENYSYPYIFFKADDGEEATYIRKNLLLPESEFVAWEDKKSGFQKLCQNPWIFITGTNDFTVNENCDIVELKDTLSSDTEGIIVWRGFPYKDAMNDLMKKIQFSGLMKLKRKDIIVPCESSKEFKPLSFNSVLSVFLVLILLILFSVLIFLCEKSFKP